MHLDSTTAPEKKDIGDNYARSLTSHTSSSGPLWNHNVKRRRVAAAAAAATFQTVVFPAFGVHILQPACHKRFLERRGGATVSGGGTLFPTAVGITVTTASVLLPQAEASGAAAAARGGCGAEPDGPLDLVDTFLPRLQEDEEDVVGDLE